jgi:hypothetical protein
MRSTAIQTSCVNQSDTTRRALLIRNSSKASPALPENALRERSTNQRLDLKSYQRTPNRFNIRIVVKNSFDPKLKSMTFSRIARHQRKLRANRLLSKNNLIVFKGCDALNAVFIATAANAAH